MNDLVKVLLILFILSLPAAWVTHCVWWVNLLMKDELDTMGEGVLAVLGSLVFPVGIVHGYVLWFN